jgi:hypothetical protein
MNSPIGFLGGLAAAVLLAGQVTAQSGVSDAKTFGWRQCSEDVLSLNLDPAPLQQFVGPEFSVRVAEGKARVLIVVQDCQANWFEGNEIGPTYEVHEWVAIEGPGDMRPVPGAERTLPTLTWFALFTGSSNAQNRKFWLSSGRTPLRLRMSPLARRQPTGEDGFR